MYQQPPRQVVEAFGGKVPRFYWRMVQGRPGAWGESGRAARARVQAVLRTVGLEVRLVTREERPRARRPGARRGEAYTWQVGELVPAE